MCISLSAAAYNANKNTKQNYCWHFWIYFQLYVTTDNNILLEESTENISNMQYFRAALLKQGLLTLMHAGMQQTISASLKC